MNIVTARLNEGLSVAQAARKIGVARGTLKRVENGETIRPASAKKIADYFGVQVVDILPLDREAA